MEKKKLINSVCKTFFIVLGVIAVLFQTVPTWRVNALEESEGTKIEIGVDSYEEGEYLEANETVVENNTNDTTLSSNIPMMNQSVGVFSVPIEVSTENELKQAIADAGENVETEITIINQIAVGNCIVIPANKNIILSSTLTIESALIRKTGYIDYILAVETGAVLTTENIALDGESATKGEVESGLIYVEGHYFIKEGTVLKNNFATNGSSLYWARGRVVGAIHATGANAYVEMTGGLIINNHVEATTVQGIIVVSNQAELKLSGGTISENNVRDGYSYGVITVIESSAPLTIEGDILITENIARGIDMSSGELIMTGGTISKNEGSGIYLYYVGNASITGGIIEENFSHTHGGGVNVSLTSLYNRRRCYFP